jgi:hypothetical protein
MALLNNILAASAELHPYVPFRVKSSRYILICGVTAIVMVKESKLLAGRAIGAVKTGLLWGFNRQSPKRQANHPFFSGYYWVIISHLFNFS